MWKTASASLPSHKEPCTKDRTGGDLFLFTHLTVERKWKRGVSFLFIYFSRGVRGVKEGVHQVQDPHSFVSLRYCACFPRLLEHKL